MSEITHDRWGAASGFAALAVVAAAMVFERGTPPAGASDVQLGLLAALVVDTGPRGPDGWYTFAPCPLYVVWIAATAVAMFRRQTRPPADMLRQ